MTPIINDIEEMRRLGESVRRKGQAICLVPTMGALHDGHLSLVDIARGKADFVVVSIFVNPTQFGPGEDFEKYPRTLEEDARKLESHGVSVIFSPAASMMYPAGYATYVSVEGLTSGLCGRSRPTHFRGVTTVVTKFFTIVRPDYAVFGRKDAQQLAVIRRMNRDLNLGVDIIAAPIVREKDGLAMSSRNRYLNADERAQAPVIHRSLLDARARVENGESNARTIAASVRSNIGTSPLAAIDYIEIVDPEEMTPVSNVSKGALLAVAVRFGNTRLIDNIMLGSDTL